MCSIFGYYKLSHSPVHNDFVRNAFDLMRHRGPDDERFLEVDGSVGLGHQRLAIIDLNEEANQPMRRDSYFLIYNGEIYNYIELKDELKKKYNVNFTTTSDTEVLLEGLRYEKLPFLNQCNGMFVFAFYSQKEKRLVLARDRFGVKPLHYMVQEGVLYFSSEIKPLVRIKSTLEANPKIYDTYINDLATDYDEDTFVKGIYQLKKGSYLIIDSSGYKVHTWYLGQDFVFDEKIFDRENDTVNFTEQLLSDAIVKRLRADVQVCITLSGGLDSATIYTLVKEKLRRNIQPFTFRHPGSPTDEYSKVEELASSYNDKVLSVYSNRHEQHKHLQSLLTDLEFPVWNLSPLAYRIMYDFIRQNHFTVVLEGHGSDEQLGGYPIMVRSAVYEQFYRGRFKKAVQLYRVLDQTSNRDIGERNTPVRFVGSFVKQVINRRKLDVSFNDRIRDVFDYRILPILLRVFDRMTMRSSLESRAPFMDYRVVEFFRRMPSDYKVSALGSKSILRSILQKYNKKSIYLNKRKMGFAYNLPAFYQLKENRDFLKSWVEKFNLRRYEMLKKSALKTLSKEYIHWNDTDAIWKTSSVAMVNQMYGIACG